MRITAQLIESATARHIWAERYDRGLDDIFALQDDLTMSVVGAIEPTLRRAEIERARRMRPESLDAYDLYLRALPLASTGMPEDSDKVVPLLEQAIELEPAYAAAHAMLALCYENRYLRGDRRDETRAAARGHAQIGLASGSDDATALATAGFVIAVTERDHETALGAIDRALAISPSSAQALGFSSVVRAWIGDTVNAIAHGERALRHSPHDPWIFVPHVGMAYAYFFSGSFEQAASSASRALQANPRFSVAWLLRTAALARLGRVEETAASARHLLDLQPGFTISAYLSAPFIDPELRSMLAEALRQAGLPE